jgi:hypothetical protein
MAEADDQGRARLPAAVYDLAIRLGVRPGDNEGGVKLTQMGRMKRKFDTQPWMAFAATQAISTDACEFDWLARLGPLGMVSARDALEHGEGRLDIMAFGVIPIARTERTPALVRGELMRYLAELAWAPDAILSSLTSALAISTSSCAFIWRRPTSSDGSPANPRHAHRCIVYAR